MGGKIHKDTARYCLGQNMDKKKILKKFTFAQICTRLYYERNSKVDVYYIIRQCIPNSILELVLIFHFAVLRLGYHLFGLKAFPFIISEIWLYLRISCYGSANSKEMDCYLNSFSSLHNQNILIFFCFTCQLDYIVKDMENGIIVKVI